MTIIFAFRVNAEWEIKGPAWKATKNGGSGNEEIEYNYTSLLNLLNNSENQLDICRYNLKTGKYKRWYGNNNAAMNIIKTTTNNFPFLFVLCEETDACNGIDDDMDGLIDEGNCAPRPGGDGECPYDQTGFDYPSTTNLTNYTASELNQITNFKLEKRGVGSIQWSHYVPGHCQNYTDDIQIGNGFISLDINDLDKKYDNNSIVTLENINCQNFNLYYAKGFYTDLNSLIEGDSYLVGNQNSVECIDITDVGDVCDSISCVDSVLTLHVKHFDGFGAQDGDGDDLVVPEFNLTGIILIIIITSISSFIIRKRNER